MSSAQSLCSDLPPFPPQHVPSLQYPSGSTEQPCHPRTGGQSGRVAEQSPITVPRPTCVEEPSVGDAKPTFQRSCMGASASRVFEKRASVSRPRRLQVMVKTIRLRTRPSGQKKQSCVRYVMKSSNSKVAVSRRQSLTPTRRARWRGKAR